MATRREFLETLAVARPGWRSGTTAKSYAQILGSNDRLNFAVIGLHGRAYAHLSSLKANRSAARISHVCDVDSRHPEEICRRARSRRWAKRRRRRQGLPQHSGEERCGRNHHRHARSLARADGDCRACRRASTCMWKSRAATIRRKARCWWRRSGNTASWCRWARSSARRRTPSRLSTRFTMA